MPFDTPIHTSSQSIDRVLNAGLPLVLVFWRQNCDPCRQLDPALGWLADDYAGKLLFAKVDADDEPELVQRFGIMHLPGLVFVRSGKPEATASGAIPETDLRRWCEYLINGGARPAIPSGPSVALQPGSSSHPAPQSASPTNGTPSKQAGGKPITLTDANFDSVIGGDLPVLVDFWAPWCGPCRMVAPVVEQLAAEYAGKLLVGKLNVDENQRAAGRYGIMSIPTLMIFRQGKVLDQVVGALPAHVLRQRVAPHVR